MSGEEIYNTARDLFVPLQGEAKYRTEGFNEIALIYGTTDLSFRQTSLLINRNRYQEEDGTPSRTIRDNTEKEGRNVQEYLKEKTQNILLQNNFVNDVQNKEDSLESFVQMPSSLEEDTLDEIVKTCDVGKSLQSMIIENHVPYENIKDAVNISLDDVGAKKQTEKRKKISQITENDELSVVKKKRTYVQNTVIHIEKGGKSYTLNGYGVSPVLQLLLGFLFHNNLQKHTLVFFVDGNSLFLQVLRSFSWHKKIIIILDWYHLKKKCAELLSLALNGRKIRNSVLEGLLPLLWHGLLDEAIEYINKIPNDKIKNIKEINHLMNYLEKNRPMIPSYAIRKKIGLRNSSNRGEKANDLLVSNRQKKNGMSWSKSGSVAMASVTALKRNKEYKKWFRYHELDFKLAA